MSCDRGLETLAPLDIIAEHVETERQIVDSILALSPAKTIVIIAHRLSSAKLCDRVYLMDGGRIIDIGTFDEIAARHPDFVDPKSTIGRELRADA